jgi:hypothetical protein
MRIYIMYYTKKLTRHELHLVVEAFFASSDFTLEGSYVVVTLGFDITLERVLELGAFMRSKGYTMGQEIYRDDDVILPLAWTR